MITSIFADRDLGLNEQPRSHVCRRVALTDLLLTLSAPASSSTSIFSLKYRYKISCLIVRIKELIRYSKFSSMKSESLLNYLGGEYGYSLEEYSNRTIFMFGAEIGNVNASHVESCWEL